ncbi:MAG: hypothetical protein R2875_00460 [Desulfobacterales bacterium]
MSLIAVGRGSYKDLAEGAFQAGQSAGPGQDIVSVESLVVKRLVREYHAAREKGASLRWNDRGIFL